MNEKLAKAIVRGTTIAWVPLGLLSPLPALFAPMMLDAPGANEDKLLVALMVSVMSFPVVCGIAVALSWSSIKSKAYWAACLWAWLPMVNILVGGGAYYWGVTVHARWVG